MEPFVNIQCFDYEHTVAPITGNAKLNQDPVQSEANGKFEVFYCDLGKETPWSGWDFWWNPFRKKVANPDIFCKFSKKDDSIMKLTSEIAMNYGGNTLDLGNVTVYPKRFWDTSSNIKPNADGYCKLDGPSGTVLGPKFASGDFYKTKFSPACQNFDCCYASSGGNKSLVAKCVKEFDAVTDSICNARLSKLNWSLDSCDTKAQEMYNDLLNMTYLHNVKSEKIYNYTDEFKHSSHCKGNDWD